MQQAATSVMEEEKSETVVDPELLKLMADLILEVMKRTKGYCGIADLLKELRAVDATFTYGDVIANWFAANQKAKGQAQKISQ